MRLKESIDEILAQADAGFADSFYKLLFEQHPGQRAFFANTNMRRQQLMLTLALQVVAYHHRRPNAAMSNFIKELGVSHRGRGITLQDFSEFRDVLLMAIEKFHGSNASEELLAAWAEALDSAIELMQVDAETGEVPQS